MVAGHDEGVRIIPTEQLDHIADAATAIEEITTILAHAPHPNHNQPQRRVQILSRSRERTQHSEIIPKGNLRTRHGRSGKNRRIQLPMPGGRAGGEDTASAGCGCGAPRRWYRDRPRSAPPAAPGDSRAPRAACARRRRAAVCGLPGRGAAISSSRLPSASALVRMRRSSGKRAKRAWLPLARRGDPRRDLGAPSLGRRRSRRSAGLDRRNIDMQVDTGRTAARK